MCPQDWQRKVSMGNIMRNNFQYGPERHLQNLEKNLISGKDVIIHVNHVTLMELYLEKIIQKIGKNL